jgi:integrase
MGVKVKEKIPGSGIYWVFINHNGKRKSKQVGSEKAAIKVAEIIQARLKLGESYLPNEKPLGPTLKQYYERFQRVYMQPALGDYTRKSYEASFRLYILPAFGTKRLDQIRREDTEEFIMELLKKDLAKDSIRLILAPFRLLFNHAKQRHVVADNPISQV